MEKERTIVIIGNFSHKKMNYNGQTIKTRILSEEMRRQLSHIQIDEIDTDNYNNSPFTLLFKVVHASFTYTDIVLLLSRNGRKVLFPYFYYIKRLTKCKIWHNVIGAASYELIQKYPSWIKYMNSFEVNWVELHGLKQKLTDAGINNVQVLPNFKKLHALSENEINNERNFEVFKFCTFSRVEAMKGIEDAISAIIEVNRKIGKNICILDIYGQIEQGQEMWFKDLLSNAPEFVKYKGIVEYNKSVEVLKDYYMLLFPTRYKTEGFPGTIIDAFASGLPVIASMQCELIENGVTGWTYSGISVQSLVECILTSISEPTIINKMRYNCIEKANDYQPETVVGKMLKEMRLT